MSEQITRIGGGYCEVPALACGFAYERVGWPFGYLRERRGRHFARLLAMLLDEGVTLLTAISLARLQMRSRMWQRSLLEVEKRLTEGETLANTLTYTGLFRPGFLQTLFWAEESGDPSNLALALRLLSGDLTPRPNKSDRTAETHDLDVFARRLRG